jgi:hypothetical protein
MFNSLAALSFSRTKARTIQQQQLSMPTKTLVILNHKVVFMFHSCVIPGGDDIALSLSTCQETPVSDV